jgi:hypothetical protein
MVAKVPKQGTLVTMIGRNHAKAGMDPRHPEVKEYMEGYRDYSLTAEPDQTIMKAQSERT